MFIFGYNNPFVALASVYAALSRMEPGERAEWWERHRLDVQAARDAGREKDAAKAHRAWEALRTLVEED